MAITAALRWYKFCGRDGICCDDQIRIKVQNDEEILCRYIHFPGWNSLASFAGKSKQKNNKIRAFLFVIINIIISDIIALMCFLLLGFNDVPLEQAANKKPGALANSYNLHYITLLYIIHCKGRGIRSEEEELSR